MATNVMEVDTMLEDNTIINEHISIVRSKLNSEKIKLWLPPFTRKDGEKGEVPLDLISRFVKELQLEENLLLQIFEYLRCHAIEKLDSRQEFISTGIAKLKIYAQWIALDGIRFKKNVTIQTSLKETVAAGISKRLQTEFPISEFDYTTIKIIHKGSILRLDETLENQNVQNSTNLMVIFKNKGVDVNEDLIVSDRIQETRKVAQALANRKGGGKTGHDHFFLEINDQQGNKINLPEEERKSLSLAMTLHEKGRSLLKQENYVESLLLFLEADQEFMSEILEAVDNYAILCLDVVWCYFKLQKLDFLPDAEQKLLKCKECLARSYGPDLERLTLIKGSDLNELAIYVRVHILEAICSYHRGNLEKSGKALDKAEKLLRRLQIDDDKFTQLLSMGFTATEARLSLRACRSDVTMAIEHITRKREEVQARKKQEKRKEEDEKLSKKYGRTAAGNQINIVNLRNLKDMGFSHEMALVALKQCDNDINQALETLQNDSELLLMSIESDVVADHLVHQFVAIGYDAKLVKRMLRQSNNNVNECMNLLLKYQQEHGDFSSSESTDGSSEEDVNEEEENELDSQVAKTLRDIKHGRDDEHLDFTLDEETQLVNKYRLLIASIVNNT